MKKNNSDFRKALGDYIIYLKKKKLYNKTRIIFYENNIERLNNWSNSDFKKQLAWYHKIRKLDKTKVGTIHLEKMKKWKYNKNTGVISHESKQFFRVEGKRVTNAKREINEWDQPFLTQVGYKGGIIGLVRCYIKNIPHYLIDAKYEPGNYNNIQLSPSLQGTYSNINRIHFGERNKVLKKYFTKKSSTIRKFWVTEDGGRLFKKRNLHWIVQYYGRPGIIGERYKWLTLWEIDKFIELGSVVGPHLRSILSLI
jgi:oxidase EvaA